MSDLIVILERYLSVDGPSLRIGGVVTRDVAHFKGVPHGAVQVAIVTYVNNSPHVLLHKRSPRKKVSPNTWDFCGGHIDATDDILTNRNLWTDQATIKRLFDDTAIREANEECQLSNHPEFEFGKAHLHCFGGVGAFESGIDDPSAFNREYSTFYKAIVPKDLVNLTSTNTVSNEFQIKDTAGYGVEASPSRLVAFAQLLDEFTENPTAFADGVERILSRVINEPGTKQNLIKFFNE